VKKYLISGIPPSEGGVGNLMKSLVQLAAENSYEVVYPKHTNKSLRLLKKKPYLLVKEVANRLLAKLQFVYKLSIITKSEIILIHPQTIGFKRFIKLIKFNKLVKIYVMDNSFFCIKSYNVLDGAECTKCLNNLDNCDKACQPFPIALDKNKNLNYLKEYKKQSEKIHFYAQNRSQAALLKEHFGHNIKIQVIGMKTAETFGDVKGKGTQYDVVFHGAGNEAKGLYYFISLAEALPDLSFFIPVDLTTIKKVNLTTLPSNIVYTNMTWDTGLKEIVINAKLVLCPSLWSAPVEGALLKSIYYNGNVGVVQTAYGFANDIEDGTVLKLSDDINIAKDQVINFLNKHPNYTQVSKDWLNSFFKNCNIQKLFNHD